MSIFTKYTTITTRSGTKIKAPTDVVEQIYKAGYTISTSNNGRYASVFEWDRKNKKRRYVSQLSYFVSDRIAGYKDGNGCNLTKSNLIMMKD